MVFVLWASFNDWTHALGEVVGPLLHEDLALLEEIPPEGVAGWVSGQDGAIYAICGWSSLLLMAAARGQPWDRQVSLGRWKSLRIIPKSPCVSTGFRCLPVRPSSSGPAGVLS